MIKTYKYNANRNTVSHILQGKNGLTVRYNFERGNVITKQKPELILRNKFMQDLLENSDLFKQGLVSLARSEAEPSDVIDDAPNEKDPPKNGDVEEVDNVRSDSDVVAYVNERWDKKFILAHKALDFATKENVKFPNYKPE